MGADHGTRHLTPATVKTPRQGVKHRPSKFTKWRREAKRLRQKFGLRSQQYRHHLDARPGWAAKLPANQRP